MLFWELVSVVRSLIQTNDVLWDQVITNGFTTSVRNIAQSLENKREPIELDNGEVNWCYFVYYTSVTLFPQAFPIFYEILEHNALHQPTPDFIYEL